MPITINDVRREVLVGLTRIRIHESDSIEVLDGDHPMQPSVKPGAGELTAGDGIRIDGNGEISFAFYNTLTNLDPVTNPTALFIAIWNTEVGGTTGMLSVQDLLLTQVVLPSFMASEGIDTIVFREFGGADQSTSIADLFADNVASLPSVTYGAGFDGGGSTIAAGTEIEVRVEAGFTITGWYIIADQDGDIQFDIWLDTFANHPPTDADSITAGNEPAISSADSGSDLTLTGWTTAVGDGDILKFRVDSATTITRASIYLIGTRT